VEAGKEEAKEAAAEEAVHGRAEEAEVKKAVGVKAKAAGVEEEVAPENGSFFPVNTNTKLKR